MQLQTGTLAILADKVECDKQNNDQIFESDYS